MVFLLSPDAPILIHSGVKISILRGIRAALLRPDRTGQFDPPNRTALKLWPVRPEESGHLAFENPNVGVGRLFPDQRGDHASGASYLDFHVEAPGFACRTGNREGIFAFRRNYQLYDPRFG